MPPSPEQWQRAYLKAYALARAIVRSDSEAKEIAQDALAQSVDPDRYMWRPEQQPSLERHVLNVVRSILKGRAKRWKLTSDPRTVATVAMRMTPSASRADAVTAARDGEARQGDRRERIREALGRGASRDLDLAVFALFEEGVVTPGEQATRLGADLQDIYAARRRVVDAAKALPVEPPSDPQLEATEAKGGEEDEASP